MRVLIVDDSLLARKSMKSMVKELGHDVLLAGNGKECITIFKEENPDLVTMDLNMPVMDGMSTLKCLMRIDPYVKVIMSTSDGFSDSVLTSLKEGASGYMLKPIEVDVLESAINKAFDKAKERK